MNKYQICEHRANLWMESNGGHKVNMLETAETFSA